MKHFEAFKKAIESCSTGKQVAKVLAKYNVKIARDNSEEVGCYSIWLDDTTRIYKPARSTKMILQIFHKVCCTYSGIPTFFGTGL